MIKASSLRNTTGSYDETCYDLSPLNKKKS